MTNIENLDQPIHTEPFKDIKGRIIQLSQAPLITDACIGYQGTTLETINYLLTHGVIPGYTGRKNLSPFIPQMGDVYFSPSTTFPNEIIPDQSEFENPGTREAVLSSVLIANDRARGHGFCSTLSLHIGLYALFACNLIDDDNPSSTNEALNEFKKVGLSSEDIERGRLEAVKRKGFIIGLSSSVIGSHSIIHGDSGDDFRVQTGNEGLSINYLTSIKPLGPIERKFIQDLYPDTNTPFKLDI